MKSHRIVAVAGSVLFGALVLGATDAAAAPPPTDPTVVDRPVLDPGDPVPPEPPRPDVAPPATDIAVGEPCDDACGTSEPSEPSEPPTPADEPEPRATQRPSPSAAPVGLPRAAPAAIPTPVLVDTGAGPGDREPVNWLLLGAPALVLLGLAAGGAHLWIRRTEGSAR